MKGKKKLMIEALQKHLGNVTLACKAANISRKTHYKRLKDYPEYKDAVEEADEFVLDFVENALKRNIEKGNVVAQLFFLKCKGKKRGYIEKTEQEITHKGGGFQLNIVDGSGKLATIGKAEGGS